MKRYTLILSTAVLAAGLLAGCEEQQITPTEQPAAPSQTETPASVDLSAKPTLKMDVDVSGTTATVRFETTSFKISPEHYSGAHVPGEGHIHLFVDGSPSRIGVKDNTYELTGLAKGKHTLEASLHTNNHQAYNVQDKIEFEIK